MSFLTPALTAGVLLVALPIVLHLIMRRQPEPLVFPAMRFVQNRRSTNQTRMRLRHWLLLLLRCLAVGLLAVALARPVLTGDAGAGGGVAAAVVIDNSPRMQHRVQNTTRLDDAKALAGALLEQLPGDSRVAVLASAGSRGKRLTERDAARLRLDRLGVSYRDRPLEDAVGDAVDLLAEREDDHRHELYVFTDLASAAWGEATRQAIATHLDRLEGAKLVVVDVGAERAGNRGLGPIELAAPVLVAGQPLRLAAGVYSTAPTSEPVVVELWLEEDGKPNKRAQTLVDLSGGGGETSDEASSENNDAVAATATASFTLASPGVAVHQGYIRLAASDALEADNTRYFTIEVQPPRPVLLVGADRAATLFVDQALTIPVAQGEPPQYETERATYDQLPGLPLSGFRAVWLLDPPELEDRAWRRLDDFARAGGSLVVALGRRAGRANFNRPAAQAVLPGPLKWKSSDRTYLRPTRYDHPALNQLADYAASIPWAEFPVLRYWAFDSLAGGGRVLAPFANGDPAIIEQPVGSGLALTVATPLSDPLTGDPWNTLPTGQDPWPFLAITKNLADYLCGATDRRLNYAAGEPAFVTAPPGAASGGYVLRLPSGESLRNSQPGLTEIVIGTTELPGNYRVQAGGLGRGATGGGAAGDRAGGRLDTGFSVNAGPAIGRLNRLQFSAIADALGTDRVTLARTPAELQRSVDLGRVGRELYPWLIAVVALALGGEHLVSNRFYKSA
ncbi:MAG: BatA domain-containing protein [Planctomycetota bacterium]